MSRSLLLDTIDGLLDPGGVANVVNMNPQRPMSRSQESDRPSTQQSHRSVKFHREGSLAEEVNFAPDPTERSPGRQGGRPAAGDIGSSNQGPQHAWSAGQMRPATAPIAILQDRTGLARPSTGSDVVKGMSRPGTADTHSSGAWAERLESFGKTAMSKVQDIYGIAEEPTGTPATAWADTAGTPAGRGRIPLAKVKSIDASFCMGATKRNALTGDICISKPFPWYTVVDLSERTVDFMSLDDCKKDMYMFKVFPLHYRTWMWHYSYNERDIKRMMRRDVGGNPFNQSVNLVLNERCVDATPRMGLFSSVMAFAMLGMFSILTLDITTTYVSLVAICLLTVVARWTNSPSMYWYSRAATFPIRAGLLVLLVIRLADNQLPFGLFGFFACILVFVTDFTFGDCVQLIHYRYLCRYKVMRELPGDLFVCRRIGAAHLEESFGSRGKIPYEITGFAFWKRTYTLICNLHGLLVELRPMEKADWDMISEDLLAERVAGRSAELYYYSLGVYNKGRPNYEAYGLDPVEEARKMLKPMKKRDFAQWMSNIITGDQDEDDEDESTEVKGEKLEAPLDSSSSPARANHRVSVR